MEQMGNKKQKWWQLLTIQAGGTICLPVMIAGQVVCQQYGWEAAVMAIILGNIFLLGLGYAFASLSVEKPRSTVEQAAAYFGPMGGNFFACVMIATMLGWFAIQLNVIGLSVEQLMRLWGWEPTSLAINMGVGTLLTLAMCFGMRTLKSFANICAPLLLVTVLYAAMTVPSTQEALPLSGMTLFGGLSIIIGANIAAVIDIPTYFRFAASAKDARACIIALYGLVIPLIECTGVYLTSFGSGTTILDVLQNGRGEWWMVWTCCFVIFSGWATNNSNLYSTIASSYQLERRLSFMARVLVLGFVGTLLACLDPLGQFELVLDMFGVTIGAMGAVIVSCYLLNLFPSPFAALTCWLGGVVVGLATLFSNLSMTGISAIDAFIVALFLNILQRRQTYEMANCR